MKRNRLILIIPIVTIGYLLYTTTKIKSIDCVSQFSKCNSDLLLQLNGLNPDNVFSTKKKVIKILENSPIVKAFSIQYRYNGKYVVRILERTVKFCIKNSDANYYSDFSGVIIKIDNNEGVNCLNRDTLAYKLGDTLTKKDLDIHKFIYDLRNISDIGPAYIDNGNLIVVYKSNIKLLFPLEGDMRLMAGKVYYIVSQFDIIKEYTVGKDYQNITEVDFRFTNPVVRII